MKNVYYLFALFVNIRICSPLIKQMIGTSKMAHFVQRLDKFHHANWNASVFQSWLKNGGILTAFRAI